MSLMRRLSMIFRSKASSALDKAEDPRQTLDYSYERTVDMLQKMRRAVTDVATSRKRLEIQGQQLEATASKLEDQARRALEQDREDLAREALSRREAVATQLEDIHRQHELLQNQESKLVASAQRLETKVAAFRTRKETIKATYSAAEAETKVNEAVSGISEEMGDVGLAMERAEEKVLQMQARSQALDELMASGAIEDVTHGGDDIERQLGGGANDSQVELEMARLKNELGSGKKQELQSPEEESS